MPLFRSKTRRSRLALLWAILAFCGLLAFLPAAQAGGGPENVLLVVNSADSDSLSIANHYIQLRQIPPSNVVYLNWRGSPAKTDINTFREKILVPLLGEMDTRKLSSQIDYVVYSSGFPWAIDFLSDVPQALRNDTQLKDNHEASLSGLTYLMVPVVSKDAGSYISMSRERMFTANRYMRLRENLDGQTWEISVGPNGIIAPRAGSADGFEKLSAP